MELRFQGHWTLGFIRFLFLFFKEAAFVEALGKMGGGGITGLVHSLELIQALSGVLYALFMLCYGDDETSDVCAE